MDYSATNFLSFELMADDFDFGPPTSNSSQSTGTHQHVCQSAPAVGPTFSSQDGLHGVLPFEDGEIQNLEDACLVPCSDLLQAPLDSMLSMDSEATNSLQWPSDGTTSQDDVEELILLSQEAAPYVASPGTAFEPDVVAVKPTSAPVPPIRRPRRQNHACDQCRSAKRACNFRNDIAIYKQRPLNPCTTCVSRSLDCTVEWLASKKASSQPMKRRPMKTTMDARTAEISYGDGETNEVFSQEYSSPIPASEVQLVRYFSARETCIQHFNLYVDVIDMPLSQFLLQGMMPRRYSLGVEALNPLSKKDSFRCFSHRAGQWVNSCWDTVPEARLSLAVAPHIFHTASVLDSILERWDSPEHRNPLTARDESINKAYKWAALASAAQFSLNPNGDKTSCRDFGYATWQRAKHTIFDNIAATGSFRLALALVIFGTIESPGPIERRSETREISTYALCEGVKRLQILCRQARLCLKGHENTPDSRCFWDKTGPNVRAHPAHNLPHEVKENLLELIAAVEWLFGFVHAAWTVISHGKIQPLGNEFEFDSSTTRNWPKKHEATRLLTLELPGIQEHDDGANSPASRKSDDGYITGPVTLLWRRETSESTMLKKMRRCGILSILLWDTLARLTIVSSSTIPSCWDLEAIRQLCININEIIKLYRANFGVFDEAFASCFQEAPSEIRRMAAMISNDTDLGILLYFDKLKSLKNDLCTLPSSVAKEVLIQELESSKDSCSEQRFISATQISIFARARRGASPGLQGADGLKAQIQDLAAHPHPAMVVQANRLAAIALSEELQMLVVRTKTREASKVAADLDGCLKALQALESSLVTFPSLTLDVG